MLNVFMSLCCTDCYVCSMYFMFCYDCYLCSMCLCYVFLIVTYVQLVYVMFLYYSCSTCLCCYAAPVVTYVESVYIMLFRFLHIFNAFMLCFSDAIVVILKKSIIFIP
jgi:hypothetical protein